MAKIGTSGRFLEALNAVVPPTVKQAIALAPTVLAICLAARIIASAEVLSNLGSKDWRY